MKFFKLLLSLTLVAMLAVFGFNGVIAQTEDDGDNPDDPIPSLATKAATNDVVQVNGHYETDEHKVEFRPLDWRKYNNDLNWQHAYTPGDCKEIRWAKLKIRAYDVDWVRHGHSYNWWEHDRVTVDGHSVGELEGHSYGWSTTSFDIDPAWLADGVINVNLNIDATWGQPGHHPIPWYVIIDYAELEVAWEMEDLTANFTADPMSGVSPLLVAFTNLSTCATSYLWEFGDGTTSTEFSPTHEFVYNACTPGTKTFKVKLTASRPRECDTYEKTISVYSPAKADFAIETRRICSGTEVVLENLSCGEICNWEVNWGDGTIESGHFPLNAPWAHTYVTELPTAQFTISLAVKGLGGADMEVKENYITVHGPVVTDFTADNPYGIGPLTVHFKDLSLGWVEWWKWDFGDGETSTEKNPCHTYSDRQKYYTVTLEAGGPCGSDVLAKTKYITVNVAVEAKFEAKPIGGIPGLNVEFTTIYCGNAGHFIYDYGDGTTEDFLGDFQNVPCPKHIYREPGEYDVTLIASGSGGKDTLHIPNLVYVDKTYRLRELQLLSGGATWPGEGWDNAVDHDIYGGNSKVAALPGEASAIFMFADSIPHKIWKIRILADDIAPNTYYTQLVKEFELFVSDDGVNFTSAFKGVSVKQDGEWDMFWLPKVVVGKYVKLVLLSARHPGAHYIEFSEFQIYGCTPTETLDKELLTEGELPTEFALTNYPNPFNPETNIRFALPEAATVTLAIYNMQGQLIQNLVNESRAAGYHEVMWNGRDESGNPVAGGLYIYKLSVSGETQKTSLTQKMLLLK